MGLIEKFENYLALLTPAEIDRVIFTVKQNALAAVDGYATYVDKQPEDHPNAEESPQVRAERVEQAKIIEEATAQARDLFHKRKVDAMAEELAAEQMSEWQRDRAAFQRPPQTAEHTRIADLFRPA